MLRKLTSESEKTESLLFSWVTFLRLTESKLQVSEWSVAENCRVNLFSNQNYMMLEWLRHSLELSRTFC